MKNIDKKERTDKLVRYQSDANAFIKIMNDKYPRGKLQRMLDLGCGSGLEVLILQNQSGIRTIGIDVQSDFDPEARNQVELCQYDGYSIPYPDAHFDGVYSYHVLEHVENLDQLLHEVTRVLRPNGFAYFGVPNRSRLIAYFGIPGKTFRKCLKQNAADYWARLQGKFRNELGAHAGFSEKRLVTILTNYYSKVMTVTTDYYRAKWSKSKGLLRWLVHLIPKKSMWPSVYVLCVK